MDHYSPVGFWKCYQKNEIVISLSSEIKCAYCKVINIEPYLSSCSCSHDFCIDCKNELFTKEKKICRICKEEVDQVMLDKRIIKKLKEIKIICLNSKLCIWRGELMSFEDHCKICDFIAVPCDLQCKEIILRNKLTEHKLHSCEERIIGCEYCRTPHNSKNYTNHLTQECTEFPLNCPNECYKNGNITTIKRKDIDTHLEKCENKTNSCEICNEKIKSKELDDHNIKKMSIHISLLYEDIVILKKEKELQNNQTSNLKDLVNNLKMENLIKNEQIQQLQYKIDSFPQKFKLDQGSGVWSLLLFSEDLLISGGYKYIKFWNIVDYNMIDFISNAHDKTIYRLTKLNDKNFISSSSDNLIKIWDIEKKVAIKIFEEHTGDVRDISILSNTNFASASFDNSIKIWNLNSTKSIKTLRGHDKSVNCLIVLKENIIISGGNDKTIRLWDLTDRNKDKILETLLSEIISLIKIEEKVYASGNHGEIDIWNYEPYFLIRKIKSHDGFINDLIIIDSNIIASASEDKLINIWDISNGKKLNTLNAHNSQVNRLVFINKNDIASGSSDKNIIIYRNFKKVT